MREKLRAERSSGRTLHHAVLLSALALPLSACLAQRTTPLNPSAAFWKPRPFPTTASRTSPAAVEDLRLAFEGETGHHHRWLLELPSTGDNRQSGRRIRARYFKAREPGRRPLVIVLPIWGSSRYPSAVMTRFLRKADSTRAFHVLQLRGSDSLVDWKALRTAPTEAAMAAELERAVDAHMVAVNDVRRLIDWAQSRPEIDRSRIGLAGFSIGAIVGALVAGQEPRLWKSALVMGGGSPENIFASCGSKVGRARKALKRRFGWSDGELRSQIGPLLRRLDPTPTADRVDPRRTLFIEADWDNCMPIESRQTLWRALGRPEKVSIRGGHHWAFLSMTPLDRHWTTRRIRRFFVEPLPDLGAPTALESS